VSAFFLVGLMVPFRSPTLRRLRILLLGSLGTLLVVQALGRTGLSAESRDSRTLHSFGSRAGSSAELANIPAVERPVVDFA